MGISLLPSLSLSPLLFSTHCRDLIPHMDVWWFHGDCALLTCGSCVQKETPIHLPCRKCYNLHQVRTNSTYMYMYVEYTLFIIHMYMSIHVCTSHTHTHTHTHTQAHTHAQAHAHTLYTHFTLTVWLILFQKHSSCSRSVDG